MLARPARIDWAQVDRDIFQETGRFPAEVDGLTLPEIVAVMEAKPEPGSELLTPAQEREYVDWWWGMTPEERLYAEELT